MYRLLDIIRRSLGRTGRVLSLCGAGRTVTTLFVGAYFWILREGILLSLSVMSETDAAGPAETGSIPPAQRDNSSQFLWTNLFRARGILCLQS